MIINSEYVELNAEALRIEIRNLEDTAEGMKTRQQKERDEIYQQKCSLIVDGWRLVEKYYSNRDSFPSWIVADLLGYPSANSINGYVGVLVRKGILQHVSNSGSVRNYKRTSKL